MRDLLTNMTNVQSAIGDPSLANVLLVDDREPDIYLSRKFLTEPLGMRCRFSVAYSGGEGLEILRWFAANSDPVDLLLLDINMPGMDGFELLEQISGCAAPERLAVVICSTSHSIEDRNRARALGVLGYLEKPARVDGLRPILQNISHIRLMKTSDNVLALKRASRQH